MWWLKPTDTRQLMLTSNQSPSGRFLGIDFGFRRGPCHAGVTTVAIPFDGLNGLARKTVDLVPLDHVLEQRAQGWAASKRVKWAVAGVELTVGHYR